MKDIIKIVVKGSSGYGCLNEAYTDKVTIAQDSISYAYKPMIESEVNPERKWTYKTDSPVFRQIYKEICRLTEQIVGRQEDIFCTDIGETTFILPFFDKTKVSRTFWCPGYEFEECFLCCSQAFL